MDPSIPKKAQRKRGVLDVLSDVGQDPPDLVRHALSIDEADRLLRTLGDPNQAFSKVMDARGENPGSTPDPALAQLSAEDLALLDRVGSGRQARHTLGAPLALLGGVLGIAPYEALKWAGQNLPGGRAAMGAAGKIIGTPPEAMALDKSSSPASARNVAAFFSGVFRK